MPHEYVIADFLGGVLDPDLVNHFIKLEIDACDENGEYHTVVFDGPFI